MTVLSSGGVGGGNPAGIGAAYADTRTCCGNQHRAKVIKIYWAMERCNTGGEDSGRYVVELVLCQPTATLKLRLFDFYSTVPCKCAARNKQ